MNMTARYNARRRARENQKLRREELAVRANVSVQTVYTTERWSDTTDTKAATAAALASALGITTDEWLRLGTMPYGGLVQED